MRPLTEVILEVVENASVGITLESIQEKIVSGGEFKNIHVERGIQYLLKRNQLKEECDNDLIYSYSLRY